MRGTTSPAHDSRQKRPSQLRLAAALILFLALSHGASAQLLDCRGGQKPTQVAELMFGRKIGNRLAVTETAWRRFVTREITSRFPEGLTVLDATGEWRESSSTRIMREPSKIVQIVLAGHPEDLARINEIADIYKARFKQQSVGIIVRPACVSF